MRKALLISLLYMISIMAFAQGRKPFHCDLYNEEYKVYFVLNFYEQNIIVPGQEILGELDGYLGSKQCNQIWAITSCKIKNDNIAEIVLINNYGSEDLVATLTCNKDNTYTYEYKEGSTLKFPVNRKWQKIPKKLVFKIKE